MSESDERPRVIRRKTVEPAAAGDPEKTAPGPGATNLTYVGKELNVKPALTSTEISIGESIVLGRRKLKFVTFCGPNVSWN